MLESRQKTLGMVRVVQSTQIIGNGSLRFEDLIGVLEYIFEPVKLEAFQQAEAFQSPDGETSVYNCINTNDVRQQVPSSIT